MNPEITDGLATQLRLVTSQYRAFVDQCCKGEDNRHHERNITLAALALDRYEASKRTADRLKKAAH